MLVYIDVETDLRENQMSIWKISATPAEMNRRSGHSLSTYFGIQFTEVGDNYVKATMPVDERLMQPLGIMHGGASCVFAETVGSTAANFCVDIAHYFCVGLDINTNHLRPVRSGELIATARPYHLGKTTQVWSIEIHDREGKLVSVTRL